MTPLSRACVSHISIPLLLYLIIILFLRYSASNNGMILKFGLEVIQGH